MDYNQSANYLRQALACAKTRKGFCAPNPAVGAVVVKDNHVLATGFHEGSGHAHAEVAALTQLSDAQANGATLYVSLEPCCHWGKTPPCIDLIIQRKIAKVIFAYHDPNPQVNQQGQQQLLAAGIDCQHYPLAEITEFYASYLFWRQNQRPFVIAKLALSLDSKIAGPKSKCVAITGMEAQRFTHQGRQFADAILTTARTIICDDPKMNVRLADHVISKPVYIMDRTLSVPLSAQIFTTASKVTIFYDVAITNDKVKILEQQGCRCIPLKVEDEKLNLLEILKFMGEDGIHELWLEAGATCFSAFLTANLAQRILLYIAPKILGLEATSAFATSLTELVTAPASIQWSALGNDGLCTIEITGGA